MRVRAVKRMSFRLAWDTYLPRLRITVPLVTVMAAIDLSG
jgi:hypothetical protein